MAETNSKITMEIINSLAFKRANIRFSGIPEESVRTELKKEGWLYSRNHNVWYPRDKAAENSLNFANHIKETYFAEPKEEVEIISEESEKSELSAMVQNGSSLREILAKLSDIYGENAVNEAFLETQGKETENTTDYYQTPPTSDENRSTQEETSESEENEMHLEQAENIQNSEQAEPPHKPSIFTFESFDYEGALVEVETDIRRGIPAYDIVGISNGVVKETRERIRAAFRNSSLEFPPERVLQSLSPADLRKDGAAVSLAMAAGILNEAHPYDSDNVLIMGDLELSGGVRPVRSIHAAVENARANGIFKVIVPKANVEEALGVPGMEVMGVKNLYDLEQKLRNKEPFIKNAAEEENKTDLVFNGEALAEVQDLNLDGYYDTARALEIAIAGKHNILLSGEPGSGKTMLTAKLMPALTPALTEEDAQSVTRIQSIAGLMSPNESLVKFPKFRMPHQTASIEGICGGGQRCSPGEISLAHNGILFLDEAAEFKSSVLQMMRVPLESGSITLSRAGRNTVYPANFQLAMATNPCPCGNFGVEGKICLCSARSIELYWKKFSDPLLDRIEIKQNVSHDLNDTRKITVAQMKEHIENALRIQRENPHYNSRITPQEIAEKCSLNDECKRFLDAREELSERGRANILKVALTIANMENRREIEINDIREAAELYAPALEKPHEYKRGVSNVNENKSNDISENSIDVTSLSQQNQPIQLTEEDLELCGKVIPCAQYEFTLELTQGEEGEFFKQKLKDIADTYRKIVTDDELVNADGTHDVSFRYFLGDTEIYISQIYTDGVGFGYTILNGDLEMSEWGDTDMEELLSLPYIEMDYHIPHGTTIERMLHDRHPDYFEIPKSLEAETEETKEERSETENRPAYVGSGRHIRSHKVR